MRTAPAMIAAYAATALVVPVLFVGMMLVWPMPLPRGFIFGSYFEILSTTVFLALLAGLPGFVVGRFALWLAGTTSLLAFELAGALAGYVAAVVLCFPSHLWVLRAHGVDLFGAGLGGAAGLFYRQTERIFAKTNPASRKTMQIKEEGS